MKKTFSLFLLTILMSMVANESLAYTFKVNGIYYDAYTSSYGNKAYVTYKSLVSLENGGSVPSGYTSYTMRKINGYDDDGDPIFGSSYQIYYTSDYSGSITIPNTVTYSGTTYQVVGIRNHAFENCSLSSLTISSALPEISEIAFVGCKGTLIINTPILSYTYYDEDDYIGYPFSHGSFTAIQLGSNVTEIPARTFSGCSTITTVTMSNSLTSIGSSAFSRCI
jgi:hypothetical protein